MVQITINGQLVKLIAYGYCMCGCGRKTNTVTHSDKRRNQIIGKPRRYIIGHQRRKFDGLCGKCKDIGRIDGCLDCRRLLKAKWERENRERINKRKRTDKCRETTRLYYRNQSYCLTDYYLKCLLRMTVCPVEIIKTKRAIIELRRLALNTKLKGEGHEKPQGITAKGIGRSG